MSDFFAKLEAAVSRNNSLLCVGLDPNPDSIPERYLTDEADLTVAIVGWNRAIIEQTADLVCAYKPNIAFYEALGADGMEALRQTLAFIPDDVPVILDVKRGDIGSTAAAYAMACFDDLKVDAVTLSPYLGRDGVDPFARHAGKGLFVLCHTSNPSAGEFQELEIADWRTLDREPNQPLYKHVARTAVTWSPNVGLVVGATFPEAIEDVRAAAPDAWFLVPGIGAQGGDLESTLAAGLRRDGSGLIISASRSIANAMDHRTAARETRDAINAVRTRLTAAPGAPAVASAQENALRNLVLALADLGAVRFGNFTLASGIQSPIYVDLRLLVSRPAVLAKAAEAYAALLAGVPCDRIAGVPYAALPIGTAVALAADKPLIYPRKEVKEHGLGKLIEGAWQPGDRVAIIEDLITSGGSTVKTAETLRAAGLVVEHAIVLIDREQGGPANLAQAGISAHAVLKLTTILDILSAAGKLDDAKRQEVLAFLGRA
ncbi:MAG: orotidine-5'-phosphate decarboxylase [Caldilinea sp.]|nr:orotidine-5'-phosphate decarboxylase [Caldilineaceae bacterium]MCW5843859.1 orotidine-5'-phosphate decarboxylase [Caldilinea sp.]